MDKIHKIGIIILIIFSVIFTVWFITKDYEVRRMNVVDWNYIQLGFNIFPADGKTLFLHGGDWKLEDFLESQEYPKVMIFYYHKQTIGCETNCGCMTWNHIYRIEDEYGNVIFEREIWQEW